MAIHGHTRTYTDTHGKNLFQEMFCSIANIFCSFQNDTPPTTTKLLLRPLSISRGQKEQLSTAKTSLWQM